MKEIKFLMEQEIKNGYAQETRVGFFALVKGEKNFDTFSIDSDYWSQYTECALKQAQSTYCLDYEHVYHFRLRFEPWDKRYPSKDRKLSVAEIILREIATLIQKGFVLSDDIITQGEYKYYCLLAVAEKEKREKEERARRIYDKYVQHIKAKFEKSKLDFYKQREKDCKRIKGASFCPLCDGIFDLSFCSKHCKYYSPELDGCGK